MNSTLLLLRRSLSHSETQAQFLAPIWALFASSNLPTPLSPTASGSSGAFLFSLFFLFFFFYLLLFIVFSIVNFCCLPPTAASFLSSYLSFPFSISSSPSSIYPSERHFQLSAATAAAICDNCSQLLSLTELNCLNGILSFFALTFCILSFPSIHTIERCPLAPANTPMSPQV